MASDLDIYISAQVLIREHGRDARAYAMGRVEDLLMEGSPDGSRLMLRVAAAVRDLERREPGDTVH